MKNVKADIKPATTTGGKYIFQLFVIDKQPNSTRAIINIRAICEKYLKGKYKLEIIDLYKQPTLAVTEDIIAVPLLIKRFPLPEIRLLGDLSDTKSVLEGLSFFN